MTNAQLRLNVPFAAKDHAKGLGARWDPQQRTWYVPQGVDIQAFKAWWPDDLKAHGGALLEQAAKPARKPAAPRASTAAATIITGPAEVTPDTSDKLPWED